MLVGTGPQARRPEGCRTSSHTVSDQTSRRRCSLPSEVIHKHTGLVMRSRKKQTNASCKNAILRQECVRQGFYVLQTVCMHAPGPYVDFPELGYVGPVVGR